MALGYEKRKLVFKASSASAYAFCGLFWAFNKETYFICSTKLKIEVYAHGGWGWGERRGVKQSLQICLLLLQEFDKLNPRTSRVEQTNA